MYFNIVQALNLSPVTPIICIQLPVEILGKRKIGEPEYTRLMSQKGVVGWVKEMSRHKDCQLHQSQPTAPGLPPSVVSKKK